MAIKPVTLKNNKGDEYHIKTSFEQVVGLSAELAKKQANLTDEQLEAVDSGANSALIEKITVNEADIDSIEAKIPAQATGANQLADKNFVNSSINAMAADFVAYNAANANFPTKAALLASTVWYHAGEAFVPKKNDYLVVTADESQGGKQTRYLVIADFTAGVKPTTEIQLQYIINDAPFTAAQNSAINSGITAAKVAQYDEAVNGMGSYLTESEAADTYATKTQVEGLGTVHIVQPGADLSGFGDNDLILELQMQ